MSYYDEANFALATCDPQATWRDKLGGKVWCKHGITLVEEPFEEIPNPHGLELSVWPEGVSVGEQRRPIFAMGGLSGDPRVMWMSGRQARELAAFLVHWADVMDEAQKDMGL